MQQSLLNKTITVCIYFYTLLKCKGYFSFIPCHPAQSKGEEALGLWCWTACVPILLCHLLILCPWAGQ